MRPRPPHRWRGAPLLLLLFALACGRSEELPASGPDAATAGDYQDRLEAMPPSPASEAEEQAPGSQQPDYPPGTAWLKVQVLREDDGLPVPEVEIQGFFRVPEKGVVRKRGPADSQGRLDIPVEPGSQSVGVKVQPTMNTAPVYEALQRVFAADESFSVEIRVPAAGQVQGTVLDEEGMPVSQARVLAWYRERWDLENAVPGPDPDVTAWTDGFGRFRLGGLAQGPFTLDVETEGMAAVRRAGGVIRHGQLVGGLELQLGAAREVGGTILDEAGEPVAGARVIAGRAGRRRRADAAGEAGILYYPSRQRVVETAVDGTFVLTGVPETETWNLQVLHAEFLEGHGRILPGQDSVELHLERGLVLAGHVVDSEGGEPLPGVQLRLRGTNQAQATSRLDGGFRFAGLKPDENAFLLAWRKGRAASISWPLHIGASIEDFELRLEPGRQLVGRTVDSEGDPIAGVALTLIAPHPVDPETGREHRGALPERFFDLDHVQSAGDGSFRFRDLRAVRYQVRAEASDGRRAEVEAMAGASDVVIVLRRGG